ncbi:MAG: hypothetical protein ABIA04_01335 [Pseudomonadota bacterium]
MIRKFIVFALVFAFSFTLQAVEFQSFTTSQAESILKGANATFAMRPLNGASSKGKVFGFEIGVATNATESTIFKALPGGESLPGFLPAPQLYAAFGIPVIDVGLELQGFYLPTVAGIGFYNFGGNVFWSAKKLLDMIPIMGYVPFLNLAPRFTFSNFNLGVEQTTSASISGVSASGSYDSKISGTTWGFNLSLSGKFPPAGPISIEPYTGIGFLSRNGEADALVAASISSTPVISTITESGTDLHFFAGLQFCFAMVALTGEYDKIFDQNSFSGKVSFKF